MLSHRVVSRDGTYGRAIERFAVNHVVRYELGRKERHVDRLRGECGGANISEDPTGDKRYCVRTRLLLCVFGRCF
jgi:hypothetical protein